MRSVAFASIYIAFFALLGVACYATKSGLPLFALMLIPAVNMSDKDKK